MNDLTHFASDYQDYSVKQLFPDQADILQDLYERCTDFFLMTNGIAPSPTAAREEFEDVPVGKTDNDIYMFGLFDPQAHLIGMICTVKQYPDAQTWWIGLMMIAPDQRGLGLGTEFFQGFRGWASAQGALYLALATLAVNTSGRKFWKKMGFEVIRHIPSRIYGNKTHAVYVLRSPLPRL